MTKFRFDRVRVVCTGRGAEVHAGCMCGMAYELLAEKKEGDRLRAKAYRARKHEQKQVPRHVTPDNDEWTDAEFWKRLGHQGESESDLPPDAAPDEKAAHWARERSCRSTRTAGRRTSTADLASAH
jgi:hypothetical protein